MFPYTITDADTGLNASAVASILITSLPPPVAVDDAYLCNANEPCSTLAPGVLVNDSSRSNGTLSVVDVPVLPAQGSVVVDANGSFVYTPPRRVPCAACRRRCPGC